jgi:hypothetical protein
MLKKAIKLQLLVLVKTQDQWPDQCLLWTEKRLMTCLVMMSILDTDKKLESTLINGYSKRHSVFIVLNILQPFVLQFQENKLLLCLLLGLMLTAVGLLIMLTHRTDLRFKVKLLEVVSQFSLDTLQQMFI